MLAPANGLRTLLRCPQCGGALLDAPDGTALQCDACDASYDVVRGIPRFVPASNYADSFGFQWNRFARTQLDSTTGTTISRDRFTAFTRFTERDLAGKLVLDVGCGAGRFAEIALSLGAHVVAVDYSNAVDACAANLGPHPRLSLVQADIYHLPFAPGSFDFVYCLGVLQHTPDVAAAFAALPRQLEPGGRLAVDVYPALRLNRLWPKYWLRPLTTRMPRRTLFRWIERLVPILLPVSDALRRVPLTRGKLRYAIPVVNYRGVFRLDDAQLREWAVLDTFDMLAPAFDSPQSADTLRRWFADAAMTDVEIERPGFLVGRGTKPAG